MSYGKFSERNIPPIEEKIIRAKPGRKRWSLIRSPLEREHWGRIDLEERESDNNLIAKTECILFTPNQLDDHIEDLCKLKKLWVEQLEIKKQRSE